LIDIQRFIDPGHPYQLTVSGTSQTCRASNRIDLGAVQLLTVTGHPFVVALLVTVVVDLEFLATPIVVQHEQIAHPSGGEVRFERLLDALCGCLAILQIADRLLLLNPSL
jgi:hypothetical protein